MSIYVTVENESVDDVTNRAAERSIEPAREPEGTCGIPGNCNSTPISEPVIVESSDEAV